MDNDGIEEALVSLPADEDGLIEWHVFGSSDGQAVDLLSWSSRKLEIIKMPKTRDVGGKEMDKTDETLILADGITFKRLELSITPIDDFFAKNKINPRPATKKELALLEGMGYPDLRIEDAQALTGDFLDYPGRERLFSFPVEYMIDDHSTYPYLLITADDEIIAEGRSAFHPWIYSDAENGVQLIERDSHGLSLIEIEPPKEE
jgi:hypothetical protein